MNLTILFGNESIWHEQEREMLLSGMLNLEILKIYFLFLYFYILYAWQNMNNDGLDTCYKLPELTVLWLHKVNIVSVIDGILASDISYLGIGKLFTNVPRASLCKKSVICLFVVTPVWLRFSIGSVIHCVICSSIRKVV